LLQDFEAIKEDFSATFEATKRPRMANYIMKELRQGSRSALVYPSNFCQLACNVYWKQCM
jgi:hypothetical protein